MKARIAKPERVILYYGIAGERRERLLDILQSEKIRAVEVTDADLGKSVGHLCGWAGFNSSGEEVCELPTQEVIVMCGIDRREMSVILGKLKENSLDIALKAVATPTNQRWSFAQLARELWREHQNLS